MAIIERLKEMLKWRTFHFLSIEKHRIKHKKDPRGCLKLYKEIYQKGYGGNSFQIINFRLQRAIKHHLKILKTHIKSKLGRIKRIISFG